MDKAPASEGSPDSVTSAKLDTEHEPACVQHSCRTTTGRLQHPQLFSFFGAASFFGRPGFLMAAASSLSMPRSAILISSPASGLPAFSDLSPPWGSPPRFTLQQIDSR